MTCAHQSLIIDECIHEIIVVAMETSSSSSSSYGPVITADADDVSVWL